MAARQLPDCSWVRQLRIQEGGRRAPRSRARRQPVHGIESAAGALLRLPQTPRGRGTDLVPGSMLAASMVRGCRLFALKFVSRYSFRAGYEINRVVGSTS